MAEPLNYTYMGRLHRALWKSRQKSEKQTEPTPGELCEFVAFLTECIPQPCVA